MEVTERRRRASFDETTTALAVSSLASSEFANLISVLPAPVPVTPVVHSVPTMSLSFDSIFESSGMNVVSASSQLPSTITAAGAPATSSSSSALSGDALPASITGSTGTAAADESTENARFLASLPFDLRQDVLLSADPAFLLSLPAAAQAEARAMRSVISGRTSILQGLLERNGSDILRDSAGEARRSIGGFSNMMERTRNYGAAGAGYTARRTDRERSAALAMLDGQTPEAGAAPAVCTGVATTLFLTDDRAARGKDSPFTAALVTRLFGCMLGVTKVRGPRPLLRLLATTCRYRSCRPWVLRALVSVLTRNSAQFAYSLGRILAVQEGDVDPSNPIHDEILMLSRRITTSSISSSSSLTTNSVEMRRFLSLLSYAMKKTNKLVWFDLLVRPEFSAYRIVGSASMRVTDLNGQEERDKAGEEWLFSSLLGLLKDPAALNSSPTLDTTLHVIEMVCEPLSHLSVSEANILASYQTNRWVKKAIVVTEVAAPLCENGHTMEVSGYSEDGYQTGYHCDYCVEHRQIGRRWLCFKCSSDICFDCFPAPSSTPPDDATAISSNSSSSSSSSSSSISNSSSVTSDPVDVSASSSSTETRTPATATGATVDEHKSKKARRSSAPSSRRSSIPNSGATSTPTTASSTASTSSSSATAESTSASASAAAVSSSGGAVDTTNPASAPPVVTAATPAAAAVAAPALALAASSASAGIGLDEQGVDIPFPILARAECMILAEIGGSEVCGGGMGKRLMRILRPLALYDGNWTQILQCLSEVAGQLAVQALDEVIVVRGILSQVVQEGGNAQAAMSLPQLTTPRSVSELRLLQVLRLMTVLRTPKQTSASALAAAAASVGAVTDLTGSVLGGGAQASSTTGNTPLPLYAYFRV